MESYKGRRSLTGLHTVIVSFHGALFVKKSIRVVCKMSRILRFFSSIVNVSSKWGGSVVLRKEMKE